ncbi:MAG: ATP/GTP-binding protein [Micrococcales bacterium]|nr:ATP/GTP-binding protein [Micrococcales bacterium]
MSGRVLDQHIAVFGERGSGKTVLLSSFYGLVREKEALERTFLDVVADDAGQGDRLMQNYLGMSREGRVPSTNRFATTTYSFTAKITPPAGTAAKGRNFDRMRLVWHDYPGEWFHQSPSGPEEAERRAQTFHDLLVSDVALVLIDGEKLKANTGEEERYLKLLFTNIRNGLVPIVDALQVSGKPLLRFPRIWMFALSKADVLPDMTAKQLREVVVSKAAHEVDRLRSTIAAAVVDPQVLAVGEDFLLLSSAKFTSGKIDLDNRVGVSLLMPIASVLPFERFLRWAKLAQRRTKVLDQAFRRAGPMVGLAVVLVGKLVNRMPLPARLLPVAAAIAGWPSQARINAALKLVGDKLRLAHDAAVRKGDNLHAAITQFGLDLEAAESKGILVRSLR